MEVCRPGLQVAVPSGAVTGYAYYDVAPDDEGALMQAVAQPVSVSIEADRTASQVYHSGVLTAACGASTDQWGP